tara:strand:- start:701 stop:1228 length:528 start_codon:yes stop_codon:yes gene_type:complete
MSTPVAFETKKIKNFQKIEFKGDINNKNSIYLYGLSDNGEPGFNIIKEIEIEGENFLINQGWIPNDLKSEVFDLKKTKYLGITKQKPKKNYFKPNNDLPKNYWFKLDDIDLKKYTGKTFSPFIIFIQNGEQKDSFPIPKKISSDLPNNHLKYSLTWFSIAISILLIYLYFRKKNY